MDLVQIAASVAAALLVGVSALQLLLAAGMPLGAAAWGGQHRVLPARLRWGSGAAAAILALAAWLILARAELIAPGADAAAVRPAVWVFAGFFALNTLGNLTSQSRVERVVMTPITVALVVCFAAVGLGG